LSSERKINLQRVFMVFLLSMRGEAIEKLKALVLGNVRMKKTGQTLRLRDCGDLLSSKM